jgi:hypothetical protein
MGHVIDDLEADFEISVLIQESVELRDMGENRKVK